MILVNMNFGNKQYHITSSIVSLYMEIKCDSCCLVYIKVTQKVLGSTKLSVEFTRIDILKM